MRKLTLAAIRRLPPGRTHLGAGLCVQTTAGKRGSNAQSWLFQYERFGKRHELGGGSVNKRTLEQAEEWARQQNVFLLEGKDPLTVKREAEEAARAAAAAGAAKRAKRMTFEQCAAAYLAEHKSEWQGDPDSWPRTLETYAYPILGPLSVELVETAHIVRCLKQNVGKVPVPFWQGKRTTAMRVRGRIEAVIDWATAHKLRTGDNPARWAGHLQHLLAAPEAHSAHAAVHYDDVPRFMAELATRGDTALTLALQLAIHWGVRISEVLNARVGDVNPAKRLATIKVKRKAKQRDLLHDVPLSDHVVDILDRINKVRPSSNRGDALLPIGNAHTARTRILDLAKDVAEKCGLETGITVHGFRSSFRDWAGDKTTFDSETCEFALAHIKAGVEGRYRRQTSVDKRRLLMAAWSQYLTGAAVADNVTAIGAR